MSLATHLARGLTRLEKFAAPLPDHAAETFTWKGAAIPCICTSFKRGSLIDSQGNPVTISARLVVRPSHFLSADTDLILSDSELLDASSDLPRPITGKVLTFRGQTLRVLEVTVGPGQAWIGLELADRHSNQ